MRKLQLLSHYCIELSCFNMLNTANTAWTKETMNAFTFWHTHTFCSAPAAFISSTWWHFLVVGFSSSSIPGEADGWGPFMKPLPGVWSIKPRGGESRRPTAHKASTRALQWIYTLSEAWLWQVPTHPYCSTATIIISSTEINLEMVCNKYYGIFLREKKNKSRSNKIHME